MEEKKKSKRGTVYTILMVICVIVFLFALYKVVSIILDYKEIDNYYEKAEEEYVVETEDDNLQIDLESLRVVNDDVIGWIYIKDTGISYPVLQGPHNEYYLFRDYEKNYLVAGSIFMDAASRADFTDDHTIIYGHNMYNGSMFGGLDKYKNESYRQEHPYIYIMLPDGRWNKYEIYSYYTADVDDGTFTLFTGDEDAYNRYVTLTMEKSMYGDTQGPEAGQKILTLSTCTEDSDDYRRNVVQAKLVGTVEEVEE